ncbi:secreted RxLR effector protein 161-like [Physcomitrium patens]
MAPGTRLSSADCHSTQEDRRPSSEFLYANAVGSLNLAAICTRHDISFATSVLAQFMHGPGSARIRACKHTFRYLRGTLAHYIEYRRSVSTPAPLYGFSDADWAGELDERRSTSGYCFILSEAVIGWSSTRHRSTALSSIETEYMAMATAASELDWLRQLLHDLHQTETLKYPTEIHCDNQSALALVDTTKFHSRTKHIAIRYHFIRQLANLQKFKLRHCSTHHMRADLFTKSLSGPKLAQHLPLLGILGGETPATS